MKNLKRYRKVDEKNYFKYFKTYVWDKVKYKLKKSDPAKVKDEAEDETTTKYRKLEKLEILESEEMNFKTFIYAIMHTFYFYMFSEVVKIIFLPAKDIVLLTLRIKFVKTFDFRTFAIWLGFELLFPILVQEIERIDSLKKKYLNKSVKNLIFNKSLKIQVQSEGSSGKSNQGKIKKRRGFKVNRKGNMKGKSKSKKMLKK